MSDAASQKILTKELADLLGFEDGAEGVLEHLLTIESAEDLLDYLSQLLGSDNEEIQNFVRSVGRFQNGESLLPPADSQASFEETTARAAVPAPAPAKQTAWPKPVPVPKAKSNLPPPCKLKVLSAKAPTFKKATPAPASSATPAPPVISTPKAPAVQQKKAPPKRKQPEQKGTAKYECGCFGSLHKPLANCLHCGRVSCRKEGYGCCNFCGQMVHPVQPPADGSITEAWARKERLLQYERESAQRTVVLDDQADHFTSQDSTWLTEEEKEHAKERSDARDDALHKRTMQLNIGL